MEHSKKSKTKYTGRRAAYYTVLASLLLGGLFMNPSHADTNWKPTAISFVNNTYHFDRDTEYRESGHEGVALIWDDLMIGTYITSEIDSHNRALFAAQARHLTDDISFIYGAATGYDEAPLMPILGLSAKLSIFRITLTPTVALFHIEFPLWED